MGWTRRDERKTFFLVECHVFQGIQRWTTKSLCGWLVLFTKIMLSNFVVFNKVVNALSIHSSRLCFVFPVTFWPCFDTETWKTQLELNVLLFFPIVFFPSHVWEGVTAARPQSSIADVTFAGVGTEGMQLAGWILECAAVWLLYTCAAAFSCVLLHTQTHKNVN